MRAIAGMARSYRRAADEQGFAGNQSRRPGQNHIRTPATQ